MKRILLCVTVILCFIFAAAESTLTIEADAHAVEAGYTVSVQAYLDGIPVEAEFSSADERFLVVKNDSVLEGRNVTQSAMEVTLNASYGDYCTTQVMYVVPKAQSLILKQGMYSCANAELQMGLGDTMMLTAETKPEKSNLAVKWSSSDERVVSVDGGKLIANGYGEAMITASLPSGRYSKCTVKVTATAERIEIDIPAEIGVGETAKSIVNVYPDEAEAGKLTYSCDNTKVCTVDGSGKITALKTGKAILTVKSEKGLEASAEIEVYQKAYQVAAARKGIALAVNETANLVFTISPSNVKYSELTYTSTNPSVAAVDENGMVTGINEGSCYITATEHGGKSAETYVTVRYVKPDTAEFETDFITMKVGTFAEPFITVLPVNASDKEYRLESENNDICVINEEGKVFAVSKGRAKLNVYLGNKLTDSVIVRVLDENSQPLEGVKIGINPGHQIALNLTQKPIAPGSSKTGNANSGYAVGVVTYTKEYQVTLNVGLYLKSMLEELGAEVVITRTENDVHIDNIQRALMLNEAGVDFAIQLHCDNDPNSSTKRGMSIFVKPKDDVSYAIAEVVLRNACNATGAKYLNVRRYSNYMSLNYSTTPTALIEMGYLSTAEDDLLLSTAEYQYKIAQGLTNGFVEYYCGK